MASRPRRTPRRGGQRASSMDPALSSRMSRWIAIARVVAGCAAATVPVLAATGCGSSRSDASAAGTVSTTHRALPGTGKPAVTIGDKNFTEQFVLGQLYIQALQANGFSVDLNQNIGPSEVTMQALHGGSLDMYPEYLDTWDG